MLVLVSPPKGKAGFIYKSMVGGKDFALLDPHNGITKSKLVLGQLEIFGDYKFPDNALNSEFEKVLESVLEEYESESEADYDQWYANKVSFAAEAYLAELKGPEEVKPEPKKKAEPKKVVETQEQVK